MYTTLKQSKIDLKKVDPFVETQIKGYHRDLWYTMVCSELLRRVHYDRYYVDTELDPFFTNLRRNRPYIAITTLIGATGVRVKIEPTSVNRRNRHQTLSELTDDWDDEL